MNPYYSNQGPPPPPPSAQGYYHQGPPPPRDYQPQHRSPPRGYQQQQQPPRDYPPPPSRDYPPPPRDYPPPARDYPPPSRDYPPPSRDYPPPAAHGGYEDTRYDRPPQPQGRGRAPPPGPGAFRGPDRPSSPDARPPRLDRRDRERAIEERVKAERPCRTLFVRNISYEASSASVRSMFESFGEIKTFFDLIQNRGMVFVTFFDLRAAQRAREALHNSDIEGRPIDVHFSLPRADEQNGRCDGDKNQGSIVVGARHVRQIDEGELYRICSSFGEVKAIRPMRDPDQKLVEFFDSRATSRFYEACQDRPFGTGTFDLRYVWDDIDQAPTPLPAAAPPRGNNRGPRRSGEGPGYMGVRPRAPPSGGGGYDRRGSDDRDEYDRDDRYRGPPGPTSSTNNGGHAEQDRLEQARKVQQLLTSLAGSPALPGPSGPAQTSLQPHRPSGPPVPNYGPPPGPPPPTQPPKPAYPPYAPAVNPAFFPPAPPAQQPPRQYPAYTPPAAAPPPPPAAPQLPPNLMAMLQAGNAPPPGPPPAASPYAPSASLPPPSPATGAPAAPSTGAMSQLLAMLAKK